MTSSWSFILQPHILLIAANISTAREGTQILGSPEFVKELRKWRKINSKPKLRYVSGYRILSLAGYTFRIQVIRIYTKCW